MLDKSIREIERERQSLQTQEKKLIAEIKKSAKQGQMVSVLLFCLSLDHIFFYEIAFLLRFLTCNRYDSLKLGQLGWSIMVRRGSIS